MYKFTNGIVVFDEKTRNSYIKAGYKLVKYVEEEKPKEVELDGDKTDNDRTIEEKHTKCNKGTSKKRK